MRRTRVIPEEDRGEMANVEMATFSSPDSDVDDTAAGGITSALTFMTLQKVRFRVQQEVYGLSVIIVFFTVRVELTLSLTDQISFVRI